MLHFHIFGYYTDTDDVGCEERIPATWSARTTYDVGLQVADILRVEPYVEIEKIVRCERTLDKRGVSYCSAVLRETRIQEAPEGYHWHIARPGEDNGYAACKHQMEHIIADIGMGAKINNCYEPLSDDHPTVDECGECGFGRLI